MRRLTTLLMTLMLMSTALWADETVTVSANSSDISEGLDLKVVAKLFAEAKNLEEFETMLNNPDSAFCNLDLNGDGQVDYLRVVETGEGNRRLIVLQAILAKDIYQDVASIYIEKDEASNSVSVQVVGDEYVYGTNYIIEPVYVYRPVIYDWFWGPYWVAWHSPWYWGYYPGWWYVHSCWAHDWYWRHCYAWHHHHHGCSFRHGHHHHHGYHELHGGVTRRDYAVAHADRSFSQRNQGMTNAGELRRTNATARQATILGAQRDGLQRTTGQTERSSIDSRTFGSRTTAAQRTSESQASQRTIKEGTVQRSGSTATTQRTGSESGQRTTTTTQRSTGTTATTQRTGTTVTTQRTTGTAQRTTGTVQRTTGTVQRTTGSVSGQRTTSSTSTTQRTTSTSTQRPSTGSLQRTGGSGGFSGGATRSGGGGAIRSGGGASRSGGTVRR